MSFAIQIRLAERNDLPQINAIYNWAVLHTVATFDMEERPLSSAEQWFAVHQDQFYPLYVAVVDGQVVGWGSLSPFHPRPAYRLTGEFSIYIAAEKQGKGIGNALLSTLCSCAEELGYRSLMGLITATNIASLRLAEKYGFVPVGHYREVGRKFEQWLDVRVVQKMLKGS